MARILMLRDANAVWMREALSGRAREAARTDPPKPLIEAADLDARGLREAERDPAILALTRCMPTRLIEPEPLDDIRADEAVPGWGISAIGADLSRFDGAGVRVALLDTGIDADHPAFAGLALDCRDFAGTGVHDANGHGTHCAGTVFGRDVEGTRIGIARGIREALIGKVLTDRGHGTTEMLFRALTWAEEAGARVISLSLGFDASALAEGLVQGEGFPVLLATSAALEGHRDNLGFLAALTAMFRAREPFGGGAVIVTAAGNESRRQVSPDFEVGALLPLEERELISVGALAPGEQGPEPAAFSNTGPVLTAPGVGIVSASAGDGLRALNGTSMACQHVAGAAALWWQALAEGGAPVSPGQVAARLRDTARREGLAPGLGLRDVGRGLVQVPGS